MQGCKLICLSVEGTPLRPVYLPSQRGGLKLIDLLLKETQRITPTAEHLTSKKKKQGYGNFTYRYYSTIKYKTQLKPKKRLIGGPPKDVVYFVTSKKKNKFNKDLLFNKFF